MEDCLFCKIIAGQIPCQKVYEDESVFSFLDINPVNPGHALVVLKNHSADLLTTPPADLMKIISVIPKIAKAITESLDYPAFNLGVNNGPVAGQIIPHLHFHIMPRREGDGHKLFPGKPYADGEMSAVAEKIKQKLNNT